MNMEAVYHDNVFEHVEQSSLCCMGASIHLPLLVCMEAVSTLR